MSEPEYEHRLFLMISNIVCFSGKAGLNCLGFTWDTILMILVILSVSLEDAHRRNDGKLFEKFKKTTVICGVVDSARSRIETEEEIRKHVEVRKLNSFLCLTL